MLPVIFKLGKGVKLNEEDRKDLAVPRAGYAAMPVFGFRLNAGAKTPNTEAVSKYNFETASKHDMFQAVDVLR